MASTLKLVCIGDSLTEGYGIEEANRWSTLLESDFNIEIINSGISGDTTGGMLARFQHMVINHQPTHVIIMGGTNDIWMNIAPEQILANLLAMTRHARHHNIVPIIGIPTPCYGEEMSAANSFFLDQQAMVHKISDFQTKLKQLIQEDERLFIDFSENMPASLFLEDRVHPNTEGHICMYKNAKQNLETFFAQYQATNI